MNVKEFLESVENLNIKNQVVDNMENKFACKLDDYVKKILSYSEDGIFFDEDGVLRLMATDEILAACEELHVDFISKKIIPIFDSGDNNFIVLNIGSNTWSKFNIVDETIYKNNKTLDELLITD